MTIYNWILLTGFGICLVSCIYQFFKVLSTWKQHGLDQPRGDIKAAVKYSFTGAMSPTKKETAYLHLPTYTAGIFFHIGTFYSFLWLVLLFVNINFPEWITKLSAILLIFTGLCGVSILIKRISILKLRKLSVPDDYFSNSLVTGFQILMAFSLLTPGLIPYLFIYSTFLFLYIPLGKLRHTVYFFTSRYHLGVFYGRRGVWPVKRVKHD